MPDVNGVLTPAERVVIDIWMKRNWKMGICPVCQNQNWVLADHVVTPIFYSQVGITQGAGYPQLMIICKNCGYTLYINASIVGIFQGVQNANP
jgi:predicted nucleic-acid-binding Zn-ribbon protein